jgi:sortase (surface protein transpeptidase)
MRVYLLRKFPTFCIEAIPGAGYKRGLMFPRNARAGSLYFPVPAIALAVIFSFACFYPTYAQAPIVQRTLAAGTVRPSARAIEASAVKAKQPVRAAASRETIGTPKRLTIESAGIDAPVMQVGLLANGKLDAPKTGEVLGWYKLNARPGERGNAVIDGQVNTAEGPGVFGNLKHVKKGDIVSVTDEAGVTRRFVVRETAVYPVDKAPTSSRAPGSGA